MQAGIVENMGKFSKVAPAGFTFVKWPLEEIKGRVNLQVRCRMPTPLGFPRPNRYLCILLLVLFYRLSRSLLYARPRRRTTCSCRWRCQCSIASSPRTPSVPTTSSRTTSSKSSPTYSTLSAQPCLRWSWIRPLNPRRRSQTP